MNQPTYKTIGKIIFWVTTLTVLASIFVFLYILNFRMNSISASELDFQGAGAAAIIIPSFSSILLAAWTIYFQIKSTTPSHKTAEQILVDIITFRNLNLGFIYALKDSIIKLNENIWLSENSDNLTPEQEAIYEKMDELSYHDGSIDRNDIKEKEKYSKKLFDADNLFFKNFANNINTTNLELEKNSFGFLASRLLPIIKFLSFELNMPKELYFDFSQFERSLNIQSIKYDLLDLNNDEEFKGWMDSTCGILIKIEKVIAFMTKNNIINTAKIERHILNKNSILVLEKIEKELKERKEIDQLLLQSRLTRNRPLS